MALVLRYVKHDGVLMECFFDIVGVKNTSAVTLKDAISDCPFAYYVHCFAHRLQLALVAAAKDERKIWQLFSHLTCIVNLVTSSPKRVGELKSSQRDEIARMLSTEGTSRHYQQQNNIIVEHHYHFDIFNSIIDLQLMELDHRFNNEVVELLTLDSALDPSDSFKSFNVENIYNLAEKFYHWDFTHQDLKVLKIQLMHYQLDVPSDLEFQNTSSLIDLCGKLVVRRKSKCYLLVDRLICLVLTLPVSTAIMERAFSGMKRIKTAMRNTMGDEFLADCMTINLERDLVWKINLESIIDEFESLKTR
ncbi:uncharacterized protein LOC132269892 [Cornus florida]|uniref:uncharacterized protein LOC132269892 n=1 Tax=Cornus florida TaxID=4283 RepID=UPI00289E981C|nr:uncharacterized protein LOC132269892 [Cornus florida]